MNKNIKRAIAVVVSLVMILLVALLAFIGISILSDYKPEKQVIIEPQTGNSNEKVSRNKDYTIVTYNMGYGGLGKEQDFFMDGGTGKGAKSLKEVEQNTDFIVDYINKISPDFAFLQEVDTSAKRSFNINQLDRFTNGDYSTVFAYNYKVLYVPVPIPVFNAMGGVESGILTLSKTHPDSSVRHQFDGEEMFLQQLFDLDRCFTVTRFNVEKEQELVLINAHFSAFDKGGVIREQQLSQMQQILVEEQQKGNYVILGGDFNHELPGTSSDNFSWTDKYPDWCMVLPQEFTPDGFSWANDSTSPTVRSVDHRYVDGENFVAVIDGFLVSNNIDIISVKNRGDFNFENSDHNPVEFKFKLK